MKIIKLSLAWIACASLLAACGGGGGNPGAVNGGGSTPTTKVASVVLTASAATIDSSGVDGTEVSLTAIVKDANNNVLPGETVSFKASSGNISNTVRVTDSNGAVTEKLNVKGDASTRTITVTANVGTVTSAEVKINVVTAVPVLTLRASSPQLASAGAAGTEVTLTAEVKDSASNVVPGIRVNLSANSGLLTPASLVTDAKGVVTALLGTGGDPTSRPIVVTATVVGARTATATINVSGNRVQVNASSSINVGASTDITVKVVDSSGNALTNTPVTFSSGANQIRVKNGGAAVTDAAGQLVLVYTATAIGTGSDTISVRAGGEAAGATLAISSSNFNVNAVNASGAVVSTTTINTCQLVAIHSDTGGVPQTGTVTLSSSRGDIYATLTACTNNTRLTTPLALDAAGNATAYVRAQNPGLATLNATSSASGVTVQGTVEFVAPLLASANVNVQASPAVIGVNTAGSTSQQSTIRAIVRDGTTQNNLVKNATVNFSIVTDPSGGALSQPSVLTTGSDGSASVAYIAGTTESQLNGVEIRAQVQGVAATNSAKLTVARRAGFISAGTGSVLLTPNSSTYQVDYTVFVTDLSGAPVPNVQLTASVRPTSYYKGQLVFNGTTGPWAYSTDSRFAPFACANEDKDEDGQLSGGEDLNNNGVLDPGIPVTVTPSVTTDTRGQAIVSLTYARDRANWLDVRLTVRGQVSGTESLYSGIIRLPGLSSDFTDIAVTPPGLRSPYGTGVTVTNAAGVTVRDESACRRTD